MSSYTHYHSAYFAHRIMLEGQSDEAFAKSLSTARVEMKPHQVEASRFALHSPLSKGVILADEVGLGKTIEACLVIAQKWAERRRNILLIVPASLRTQWQQELQQKFSLPSIILDSSTYRRAVNDRNHNPLDNRTGIIIMSYQFAAARADNVHVVGWDLVVIDEAHRLRNAYKTRASPQTKKLLRALAPRMKILLTGTPLQNSLMELYGLVSSIDDNFFGNEKSFRIMYGGARDDAALTELRKRLSPIYKRHLRRDVQAAGHVSYTNRVAVTFDFEPYAEETQLYEAVSEYLQDKTSIAFGSRPNHLVLIGARKTLGSSVAAITKFLEIVLIRLRDRRVADESVVADIDDTSRTREEMRDAVALSAEASADRGRGADSRTFHEIDAARLASEIGRVEGYLALARSIGSTAKGEKLIQQLPNVLREVGVRGGRRKAVIFTESVRTQHYLFEFLSENGYAGEIVLMNGSNNDAASREVYADWKNEKEGTDAISGSKSADMKTAIVGAFESDEKSILIATESGAEGINLQFCSLVINFDLPWNPQRVEQRIGRCHRYGQKIDVTVVNMINRQNHAEKRIYELLSSKFKLFEGVFGASDGILGTIESGVDFEKKILAVVQSCRSEHEIDAAFKDLGDELEDQIKADMARTRQQLFESFDASIVDMLQQRNTEIELAMTDFEQRLWLLARAELPDARFEIDEVPCFHHDNQTWSMAWPFADEKGWQFFRLGDNTLADRLVAVARSRDLPQTKLVFDYQAYREEGQPRLADVEQNEGRSGWLSVELLKAETAVGSRDRLVIAAMTDDGEALAPETAERFFLIPASSVAVDAAFPSARMTELSENGLAAARRLAELENGKWLEEETEKLAAYAADLRRLNELRSEELAAEVNAARMALRSNQSLASADRLTEQRRIKKLEDEHFEMSMSVFRTIHNIRKDMDDKLDKVARNLTISPTRTSILTVQWELPRSYEGSWVMTV
ncbi:MAG TPA: DEAD/DEAH box helicase [Aurantimonas coralicida]|uniref:DEAD/DEAH box helicase n=2 Tax=root TaxID=1 RepID=A0A9C9THF1_9HYPH|nr:DEAD/DEAH box helicase [Aurantimonas coralicida]HEU01262.1 DEAD/DEAH box helicase [Aurantimonas coralicida]